jgi:hypothetical protein
MKNNNDNDKKITGIVLAFYEICITTKKFYMVNHDIQFDFFSSLSNTADKLSNSKYDNYDIFGNLALLFNGKFEFLSEPEFANKKRTSRDMYAFASPVYFRKMIMLIKSVKGDDFTFLKSINWGLCIKKFYNNLIVEIPSNMPKILADDYLEVNFWECCLVSGGNVMLTKGKQVHHDIELNEEHLTVNESVDVVIKIFEMEGIYCSLVDLPTTYDAVLNESFGLSVIEPSKLEKTETT